MASLLMLLIIHMCFLGVHPPAATAAASSKERRKFTRQDVVEDFEVGGIDPSKNEQFRSLFMSINSGVLDKFDERFDRYLESAKDGSVKTASNNILTVVNSVGQNAAKLKSKDGLQVMEAIMSISAAVMALAPGGQPAAVVLEIAALAISMINTVESESSKMQKFIMGELWSERLKDKKHEVRTFLAEDEKIRDTLIKGMEREQEKRTLITYNGLKEAMNNRISGYGALEIGALWTEISSAVDPSETSKDMKTAGKGLQVYNLIYTYVRALTLRDITLELFIKSGEMALHRNCSEGEWVIPCAIMDARERYDLLYTLQTVHDKMKKNRDDVYHRVGDILEHQVKLENAHVLMHHHPIGWNDQSEFISTFIKQTAPPDRTPYQADWEDCATEICGVKKFILQSVKLPHLHVEPEDDSLLEAAYDVDQLTLEDSTCHIEYAVEFEKIFDEDNKELNGYFTLTQPRYEGVTGGSWDQPRLWKCHQGVNNMVIASYFQVQLDLSVKPEDEEVYRGNSTGKSDEYLFIVLTDYINEESRCSKGTKPRTVIVPKLMRDVKKSVKTFVSYKNRKATEGDYIIDGWDQIEDGVDWYLHDCQGRKDCPGCHAITHVPKETRTVDGKDCPSLKAQKRIQAKAKREAEAKMIKQREGIENIILHKLS